MPWRVHEIHVHGGIYVSRRRSAHAGLLPPAIAAGPGAASQQADVAADCLRRVGDGRRPAASHPSGRRFSPGVPRLPGQAARYEQSGNGGPGAHRRPPVSIFLARSPRVIPGGHATGRRRPTPGRPALTTGLRAPGFRLPRADAPRCSDATLRPLTARLRRRQGRSPYHSRGRRLAASSRCPRRFRNRAFSTSRRIRARTSLSLSNPSPAPASAPQVLGSASLEIAKLQACCLLAGKGVGKPGFRR